LNISQKHDAVIRIDISDYDINWKQHILFLSDIHLDSPYCDRKLLSKQLDEAIEKNALIFIAGDLFDGMQGRDDPRRTYAELKEKYKGVNYFDLILNDAVEFFKPYKDNLAMIGYGNHEYSVLHHNGTDLVQRFVGAMRGLGSPIVVGGYGGFIRIGAYQRLSKTPYANLRIFYNHGGGGEAPVTKGMIQTNRQAAYIRGCDVVWNGHNHQEYISHQATLELNNKDNVVQSMVAYIRTPGYKNEYGNDENGYHGFAATRMLAPTPRGCVWGELSYNCKQIAGKFTAEVV
jgi:predicted phosphodiesterase